MSHSIERSHAVLVLHSEPIVAVGLGAALRRLPEFDVLVGQHDSETTAPDVVVSDYEHGVQLAAELHAGHRWAPRRVGVVVLAARPSEYAVHAALSRGVLGYLVTGCALDELVGAVRAAAAGKRYLCHAVAQQLANGMMNEALTSRERDVLRLLANGRCNKAIANELAIAIGTVKAHVRGIMSKLNATSRTEAASIAAQRGLLSEDRELVSIQ